MGEHTFTFIIFIISQILQPLKSHPSPGWFGSVDRALACRLKIPGSILVKHTCPSCRLHPQWGACRGQPINDYLSSLMFLTLFPSPFLSEINKKSHPYSKKSKLIMALKILLTSFFILKCSVSISAIK
uniref:Uncharacterized protein n=1 Tax=Myotis myotis TaxID=51298 RepID=A0A7J7ZY26_MYOMY|nr:hypothetical protein mMyoMyo1_009901 [Myotis myotis]